MAATTSQPPVTNSKYFLNPQVESSPPETYLYGKGANTTVSAMPHTPPQNNDGPPSPNFSRYPAMNYSPNPPPVRQLRPPRQPLYVPAALRPTELPSRAKDIPTRPRAPDTPPASKDNSFDSAKAIPTTDDDMTTFTITGAPNETLRDLVVRLRRAATEESMAQELEPVTGPPQTAHWKPDALAKDCFVCQQTFTFFFRKHHCRRCGQIVCHQHSKSTVPLDQRAEFHPDGKQSRACDHCYKQWVDLKRYLMHRASESGESSHSDPPNTSHREPVPTRPMLTPTPANAPEYAAAGASLARTPNDRVPFFSTF